MGFFRRLRRKNARHGRVYSRGKKSAFGGDVASMEEVSRLSKKIQAHEEQEFEAFEKEFDKYLDKHFPEEEEKNS